MEYFAFFNIWAVSFILSGMTIIYLIGYAKGFSKAREIDDKIIDNLVNKYKSEDK